MVHGIGKIGEKKRSLHFGRDDTEGTAPSLSIPTEEAPFLKAIPVFDEEAMRSVIGCSSDRIKGSAMEWLEESRGLVELPTDDP